MCKLLRGEHFLVVMYVNGDSFLHINADIPLRGIGTHGPVPRMGKIKSPFHPHHRRFAIAIIVQLGKMTSLIPNMFF
ncbi:hypothetical protein D3C72_2403440 [compost metagenome]